MGARQLHDVACVIHLHSLYSDGTGTVAEIARAAERSGADVVLLTDHDTLEARRRGEEGWHGRALVLVGEEVSPRGGNHYLAFGIEDEIDHRDLDAEGICRAVARAGGFGFAAHPFSRGSRRFKRGGSGMPFEGVDCDALEGIELWSFVTDTAEHLPSVRAALRFIAAPGRVVDHPPEENVREWDRLCRSRRVTALGGLDAHQFGKRIGPFVPLRLMSYRRSFRHLRTHVLCEEPLNGDLEHDRAQVYGALRAGRCYIAVDSVVPAPALRRRAARSPIGRAPEPSFALWAEGPAGTLTMGEQAAPGDWTLRAQAPRVAHLRLLRDGEEVAAADGAELEYAAREPGAYRVEARRESRGAERTWIISNPIYLR